MKTHECAVCGEHSAIEVKVVKTVDHKGESVRYESRSWVCQACESDYADAEQSRLNKRALIAAKAASEGVPSCFALKKWRKKWAMTQQQAGQLLGVGPVAFSKYENDDQMPSDPTARLLFLVTRSDECVRLLADRFGVQLGGIADSSVEVEVVVTATESVRSARDEQIESALLTAANRRRGPRRSSWFSEEKGRRSNEASIKTVSL